MLRHIQYFLYFFAFLQIFKLLSIRAKSKVMNSSSQSRKKYDWGNFTTTPRQGLGSQNTSVVPSRHRT